MTESSSLCVLADPPDVDDPLGEPLAVLDSAKQLLHSSDSGPLPNVSSSLCVPSGPPDVDNHLGEPLSVQDSAKQLLHSSDSSPLPNVSSSLCGLSGPPDVDEHLGEPLSVQDSAKQLLDSSDSDPLPNVSNDGMENKNSRICHFCAKKLSKRSLAVHIKRFHTGEQYNCEKCKKSWNSKTVLERHNLSYHSTYSCQYCLKEFFEFRKFRKHVVRHSNIKKAMCELCSKQFMGGFELRRHVLMVHTQKTASEFVCKQCGASFKTSNHLKRHSAIHLPEKPFVCQFCGKRCSQSTNLKVHIMGVHKDKSYLVYPDNSSVPPSVKVDHSSLIIPSFKDYMPSVKKDKKIGANKKPVKPRNQSNKTDKQTKSKINCKDVNSKGTSETTDDASSVNVRSDVCNNNEQANLQRDLNIDQITLGEIEFVKLPSEWNVEQQSDGDLYDCKLQIPLKVEAIEPSDYTNNLDIPVEDYEPWDNANDTELYESKIITSKDTEAPDTKLWSNLGVTHDNIKLLKLVPCKYCRENFTVKFLDEHIATLHSDKMYVCQHCPKKLKTSKGMKYHALNVHKEYKPLQLKKRTPKIKLAEVKQEIKMEYEEESHASGHMDDAELLKNEIKTSDDAELPDRAISPFSTTSNKSKKKKERSKLYEMVISQSIAALDRQPKPDLENKPQELSFPCKYCKENFELKLCLDDHIATLHSDKMYVCQHCPKKSKSQKGITFHALNVHREYVHSKLKLRRKKFIRKPHKKSKSGLYKVKKVENTRIYVCQQCPKTTKKWTAMKHHIFREHTQTKPFKCSYCPKSFKYFHVWKQHVLYIHMKQRNYLCHICSKCFQSNGNLKDHINSVHLNIKNYSCDTCGESFTTLYALKNHIRIHSNIRAYKCQFCVKQYTHTSNLRKHIKRVHRDISHHVYKKPEPLKPVDPSTIIIPANPEEFFKMFPPVANALESNEKIPEQSQNS